MWESSLRICQGCFHCWKIISFYFITTFFPSLIYRPRAGLPVRCPLRYVECGIVAVVVVQLSAVHAQQHIASGLVVRVALVNGDVC